MAFSQIFTRLGMLRRANKERTCCPVCVEKRQSSFSNETCLELTSKTTKIQKLSGFHHFVAYLSNYQETPRTRMVKTLNKGTPCWFGELSSDCRNLSKIFKVFVVFDAISVQFPRDIVVSSNAINNKRMSYALLF